MSKAQENKNELAIKDKQTSTALTVAQMSDNMPIVAGDIESAVTIISEGVTQGKKAWINTALAVRKVLAVDGRGKQKELVEKLCARLNYSRSMVFNYRNAGDKLLTQKPDIDKIPYQITEFLKKAPKAPNSGDILNVTELARWTIGEKKWVLFKGELKDGEKVKSVGFRIRAEKVLQPIVRLHKQGSLLSGKKSIDYTAYFANEPDKGESIDIYTVDIGE